MKKKRVIKMAVMVLVGSMLAGSVPTVTFAENQMILREPTKYEVEKDGIRYRIDTKKELASVLGRTGTQTDVVIPEKVDQYVVTEIGEYAFERTDITSVQLPDGLKTIAEGAFRYCNKLERIDIPESVDCVYCNSFEASGIDFDSNNWKQGGLYVGRWLIDIDQNKLTNNELNILEGTKKISVDVFNKKPVRKLGIPASLEELPDIRGVRDLEISKDHKKYSYSKGLLMNKEKTELIKVIYFNLTSYFVYRIPSNIKKIDSTAFTHFQTITPQMIYIPKTVTTIEKGALFPFLFRSSNKLVLCENTKRPKGWSKEWAAGEYGQYGSYTNCEFKVVYGYQKGIPVQKINQFQSLGDGFVCGLKENNGKVELELVKDNKRKLDYYVEAKIRYSLNAGEKSNGIVTWTVANPEICGIYYDEECYNSYEGESEGKYSKTLINNKIRAIHVKARKTGSTYLIAKNSAGKTIQKVKVRVVYPILKVSVPQNIKIKPGKTMVVKIKFEQKNVNTKLEFGSTVNSSIKIVRVRKLKDGYAVRIKVDKKIKKNKSLLMVRNTFYRTIKKVSIRH